MDFSKYGCKQPKTCDTCEFYEEDDDGDHACSLNLDEDERVDFLEQHTKGCPYYRYYDEYKSVHRQI